ncbi:AT-hook motif nuclear-localized protein 3-like [Arachis stenosperma]|uniref:AT-hook motif nuclear-localized protein 3-like n=1 Tax=Arachis stenosperma TaxID=217475 RepID=UPI0025AD266F|nr:AT-hook motif nuclear-localized protein 3-like [Arachis stenosperma]XP_057727403.1 AT-hook motif nuclear-localized protein 3-like [Arachis stenosperma]XP_057727404.1 AT-hook motif nuclear-localized protein 3-like [Arachis stenosperma]
MQTQKIDCFKVEALGRPVPFQLYVNPGEDVKAKLVKLFKSISHSCCIISASGHISTAEFSNLNSNNSDTYEGHFEILSLTGNCWGQEDGASWWLNVMLAGPNRMAFGSIFIDRLIAADTVVLLMMSLKKENEENTDEAEISEEKSTKKNDEAETYEEKSAKEKKKKKKKNKKKKKMATSTTGGLFDFFWTWWSKGK